ncbi:MAG: hypothetical protein JWM76_2245 [Pseudonocardiales bacterium]|nr:hypothetical protein [Pseudonocardiales bacterium]
MSECSVAVISPVGTVRRMIYPTARCRSGSSAGLILGLVILTGCTSTGTGGTRSASNPPTALTALTALTASTPATATASLPPPSSVGSSIPPATNQSYATASTSFSASAVPPPTPADDALRIVVAGAGTSETAVTGATCGASQVDAQVGSGTLMLDVAAGTLHLKDVAPVGTLDFVGSARRIGTIVMFTGAATGTSVALKVTCT